jgi:pre-mRNA-splicing factor 38A
VRDLCFGPQKFTDIIRLFPAGYNLTFMDEFVDQLLTEERVCDLILPRLQKRSILEENGELGPRKSRLLDAMEGKEERSRSRSRSSSRTSVSSHSRNVSRGRSASGDRSPSPAGSRYVSRSRSRSKSVSDAGSRYVSRSPSRSRSGSPAGMPKSPSADRMEEDA